MTDSTNIAESEVFPRRAAPPISRPEDYGTESRYHVAIFGGFVLGAAYLVFILRAVATTDYSEWAGFALAPLLFMLSVPLLTRMLRAHEPDLVIRQIVIAGLAFKLAGAFARFYANVWFLGTGDSQSYSDYGTGISSEFRQFVFSGPLFTEAVPEISGTMFIRLLTGAVYTVIGPSMLGGFVVFAFMSFWGQYLFYRAFRIAVPDGLHRRYSVLVFALPSMVFWPSSIGKEAWMITMLGLCAYGLARVLRHLSLGYSAILASFVGMGVIRPHVAAIAGVGIGVAVILRRSDGQSGSTVKKVFGLLLLVVTAGVLMSRMQAFFSFTDNFTVESILDETSRRTGQGGSQFSGGRATGVAGLPWAVLTVLFRPFLFETNSAVTAITSLEGTVLLGLFVTNIFRLARLPALMVKVPFIGFALAYTIIFAFTFSSIGNFGILARQRTQLFPVAAMVLCVPYDRAVRTRSDAIGGDSRDLDGLALDGKVSDAADTAGNDNLSDLAIYTEHWDESPESLARQKERWPSIFEDRARPPSDPYE